jgi:hypothetical protein
MHNTILSWSVKKTVFSALQPTTLPPTVEPGAKKTRLSPLPAQLQSQTTHLHRLCITGAFKYIKASQQQLCDLKGSDDFQQKISLWGWINAIFGRLQRFVFSGSCVTEPGQKVY